MATKGGQGDSGGTENEPNTIDEDRISELPDALIHYIFSFLPTKYIGQMCLLSQCWRLIRIRSPFLYFIYFAGNMFPKNYQRYRKLYTQIPDTCITSFKLRSSQGFKAIEGWL